MKKILIIGSNGQLGQQFKEFAKYDKNNFYIFIHRELDITNKNKLENFTDNNKFDVIINCAAYTHVDMAENRLNEANLVNVIAPGNLALVASKMKALLIHFSTDYVFDGSKVQPLNEDDEKNPLNVYGYSKLKGEEEALRINENTIIIRTSWVYSKFGNNFVSRIIHDFNYGYGELNIVQSQIGSPTYAYDLVSAVMKIIESEIYKPGVYHYSNEGVCSWYDFAMAIKDILKSNTKINPVENFNHSKIIARRPNYSVLNKDKIKRVYNIEIPHWRNSLEKLIFELK